MGQRHKTKYQESCAQPCSSFGWDGQIGAKNKYRKTCPGKPEISAYVSRGGFFSDEVEEEAAVIDEKGRVIGHRKINIEKNVPEPVKIDTSKQRGEQIGSWLLAFGSTWRSSA
jgi:hypothetical protein